MANILGSLQVELAANTAKFVDDMGKAAYAAKQTAREIDKSFSSLSRIASQTFGPFGQLNPIISQLSFIVAQTGHAASEAMGSFGKFNSAIGATAALGAGAVAAMSAISLGAAAMAIKTTESASKMYTQAQAAGVSTEALSGLSFAAKQSGVDQEVLVKALERMSASAFKAATAPVGTINAYTRLGLSAEFVRAHLNDTVGVFAAVADKIGNLGTTASRTAVLGEIFGIRFGPQLAAMMAQGGAAIQDQVDLNRKLGAELDEKTALAAHRFQEELGKLETASRGFQLALMRELLPALDAVAVALERFSEPGHAEGIKEISYWFGALAITAAGAAAGILEATVLFEDMIRKFKSAPSLSQALLPPGVGATLFPDKELATQEEESAKKIEAIHKQFTQFAEDIKKGLNPELHFGVQFDESKADKVVKWIENLSPEKFSKIEAEAKKLGITMEALAAKMMMPSGGVDLSPKPGPKKTADDAFITKAIAKLQEQTAAELALAAATGQTVAAQHMQQAENEADVLISRLLAEADTKDATIRAKLRAEIEKLIPAIHALTAEEKVAKDAVALNAELDKQTRLFNVQIASLDQLAAAYRTGGAAIASAAIAQKLEAEREKVDELAQEYELAASKLALLKVGTKEYEKAEAALADLKKGLDAANASLELHGAQAGIEAAKNFTLELAKQTEAFRAELPALDQLNRAYLENADAVREAQVQVKVVQAIEAERQKGHELTATEIRELTDLERDKARVAYEGTLKQEAARFDLFRSYEDEITKLNRVREVLQEYGRSTIAVDAEIYDANLRLIEQWDAAALKVGTLGEKFHALFNEIILEGQKAGENIFAALKTAIDDISTQLAKFVTTGKANFKQLFQSLEESIVKASFQKLIGDITAKVTGGIFGVAAGKPDGSELKPFYVIPIGAGGLLGAAPTAGAPAAGGIIGLLKSIFGLGGSSAGAAGKGAEAIGVAGKATETTQLAALGTAATATTTALASLTGGVTSTTVAAGALTPEFASMTATMAPLTAAAESTTATMTALTAAAEAAAIALETVAASGGGGGGGFISSLFGGGEGGGFDLSGLGGFAQHGADVAPGKAYVVGEKRPEIFISKVAGRILPSVPAGIAALAKIGQSPGQSAGRPFMATPAAAVIAALLLTAPAAGLAAGPSGLASAPPAALSSILRSSSSSSTLIKILERQGRAAGGEVAAGATYLTGERRPEVFMPEARGFSPGAMSGTAALPKMGSLGLNFGGFRQMGGDVSPGMAYVTGEQHPEIFIPDQPARPEASGEASQSHQTVINMGGFHVHGVTDFDSFRKSQSQIMAEFYRAAAIAHSRNR